MIQQLLKHEWLQRSRSGAFSKQIATTIMIAFLVLMFGTYLLLLAFNLQSIIENGFDQDDSISFLNSGLIYYFIVELTLRFFLQNSPVLDIQPYLHLPVRKSSLIHFLVGKSLFSLLNILALVLFAPFAFSAVQDQLGGPTAYTWLATLFLLALCMHLLMLLFNKKLSDSPWSLAIILGFFGLLAAIDHFGLFKLSDVSMAVFNWGLESPYLLIISLVAVVGLYWSTYRYYITNIYLEELSMKETKQALSVPGLSFLKNMGLIGELIGVEWRLILRHKRTRSALMLCGFFLFYGLIFYTNDLYLEKMPSMLLFVGIFITGIFMINYGQFLFSWQAAHFDFMITRPLMIRQLVLSKYWLLVGVSTICFLLTTPYVFFGWKILVLNACMFLFNIGINVHVIMNISMWSPKRINLEKGSAFNYEGIGAAQWLMGLPVLLAPYVIYWPLSLMGQAELAILILGAMGLLTFVFRDPLIDLTTRRLAERKHSIAFGFRNEQ